jgi:hypothetical protein
MTRKKTTQTTSKETMKSTPPSKKVTRPWQGTFLAVLNIISLIITAMFIPFIILMIIAGGVLSFANDLEPIFGMILGGGGIILGVMLLIYFILGIFITKGLFKGRKWAVIILLIFSFLGLINLIFNFDLITLIIVALCLYLEIACLLHPFYSQTK